MNPKLQAVKSTSSLEYELRQFFASFSEEFNRLASGERSDKKSLLRFFSAPLRFIGPVVHLVLKDENEIISSDGIGGQIDQLTKVGFGSSNLSDMRINSLNPQAALVQTLWRRRDKSGNLIAEVAMLFLLAKIAGEWRITSLINVAD